MYMINITIYIRFRYTPVYLIISFEKDQKKKYEKDMTFSLAELENKAMNRTYIVFYGIIRNQSEYEYG